MQCKKALISWQGGTDVKSNKAYVGFLGETFYSVRFLEKLHGFLSGNEPMNTTQDVKELLPVERPTHSVKNFHRLVLVAS